MSDETTDPSLAALREAILAGDRRGVLDLVRDVRDPERLVLGPALETQYDLTGDDWKSPTGRDRHAAYQLARLATAVQPQRAAWSLTSMAGAPLEEQIEALAARPVAWKRRFATSALSRVGGWRLVHAWVGAGVIAPPSSHQWTLGVLDRYPWDDLPRVAHEDAVVAPLLARLLDTPGAGRTLGQRAKYGAGRWRSLVEACGGFDPERRDAVVDGCLSQLVLAMPTEALGFVTVLSTLELTQDELARRQGRYAALLLAPSPQAQTLATETLRALLERGTLDPDTVLDLTTEVLQGPKKVRVREHLRLLEDAVARGVVDVGSAAAAVAEALDPERSDVVVELATSLGRWSAALTAEQVVVLQETTAVLVPQPWPELRRALGPLAPSSSPAPAPVPAPLPDPVDLGSPAGVVPVADLDELLVLMEEVLPTATTVIQLERALDGMARLRLDGIPAAVRLRADRATSAWRSSGAGRDVDQVISAWLGHTTAPVRGGRVEYGQSRLDDDLPPDATQVSNGALDSVVRTWTRVVPAHDPEFLTSRRIDLVRLRHLTAPPGPLLALPTSQDGTLGVDDLLARLRKRDAHGLPQERYDLGWALLRVRPDERDALLGRADLPAEVRDWAALVARTSAWEQVVVSWDHASDAALWHDPGAPVGSMDDPVRAWLGPDARPEPFRQPRGAWASTGSEPSQVTLWSSALPSHPDVLVAHAQLVLLRALSDEDTNAVEPLVRSLGVLRAPWGRPTTWAVAMGLSAQHRPSRRAASEAVATGAASGMLVPATLTQALLDTVGPDAGPFGRTTVGAPTPAHPMLSRVADGLADAARIDDRTADVVQRGVLAALPQLLGRQGAHTVVAVAAQLAERLGRRGETPAAVLDLAAGRSQTRTATEARRLVAAVGAR